MEGTSAEESFESSEISHAAWGDKIGFVLSFLKSAGLDKAETALLNEIGEKFPELRGSPSEDLEDSAIGAYTAQTDSEPSQEPSQEPERWVPTFFILKIAFRRSERDIILYAPGT